MLLHAQRTQTAITGPPDSQTVALLQSQIEDTKGNNGEQGQLTMTNLRLMWVSDKSHKTNLTLGYNCIVSINIKEASSRLRGTYLSLSSTPTSQVFLGGFLQTWRLQMVLCRHHSSLVCLDKVSHLEVRIHLHQLCKKFSTALHHYPNSFQGIRYQPHVP